MAQHVMQREEYSQNMEHLYTIKMMGCEFQ